MANKNNLFIENHRLKEKLSEDRSAFQRLLTTMAHFHRYSVDQQMNLYEHAPAGATAMATADFWQSYLHTTIAPDATPTPVLIGETGMSRISSISRIRRFTEKTQKPSHPSPGPTRKPMHLPFRRPLRRTQRTWTVQSAPTRRP